MSDAFSAIRRPQPLLAGLTKEFYDWCARGELRFQRCKACGRFRHVPREICAHCAAFDWEWAPSGGRGAVYSWTVVERALHPAFAAAVPYAPVVVEMDEGVRLVSRVADCPPAELAVGMRLRVDFETLATGLVLPCFRRA